MSDYAPIARIVLRYLVGAAFVSSPEIGKQLATDPDVIALILQSRIARYIGGVLGAVLILAGALIGIRRNAVKGERQRVELKQAKADLKAERERVVLDAELDQETDLLARGRRVGVVRKDKP